MTFSPSLFELDGISKKTVEDHLKLYAGYVTKYNEITERMHNLGDDDYAKANQVYSFVRELKVELSFAYGGVVNHELYFAALGGGTQKEPGSLLGKQIATDFGSFENYKRDLKASGLAARGWVWTAWNSREKRLVNYVGDAQNSYPVWYATPVLALDTYEHAYFADFAVNRAAYIDVFFRNVNWGTVEESFSSLAKK